ncbi:MAG: phage major capsid protein [Magnetococcales bacterium]|nr:phage major capsid protein [Magnetococcales bacterium]
MSEKLKKLQEQRRTITHEMRAVIDSAEAAKRDMTSEETVKHGELFNKQEALRSQIEVEQRQIELDREMASTQAAASDVDKNTDQRSEKDLATIAFRNYLATGRMEGEGVAEFRALQAGNNSEGGYLVAPEQFVAQLIQGVDNAVFMRQKATKFSLTESTSMGAPSLDTGMADADWTVELGTGSEDTSLRFGKRELKPTPVAKRVKVSKKLLSVSALPIESIIQQRLAYKFGVTQEKAFLTGSGSGQPLGVFTASAQGISTGRDISTGNTATALTFDGLIEAKYNLKAAYWGQSDWMFHRDAVKMLTKLKDGDGQYIWREGVSANEPDTLLGRPLMISEYAPNTFTTGLYVGILGDFSNYWIADALNMQVQRLVELYAETNQDGFIGRMESDGMPVLEEAFSRVTLA